MQQLANTGKRRFATLAATGLAALMGWHVVFGHNGVVAYEHKRAEANELRRETSLLSVENQRLQDHVGRLQNDPDAIEHQAREELHYTRTGEVIYTLPNERPTPQPPPLPVSASN